MRSDRDDIGVDLKLTVDPPMLEARTGRLGIAGKLEYRRPDKAFYVREPKIEVLELEGLPPDLQTKVTPVLEAIASSTLTTLPVYRFERRNAAELTTEHVLEAVTVRNGRLIATLGLPR